MQKNRRFLHRALIIAGLGAVCTVAHAQADFPSKPVRLVVGWTPGGLADIASRTVGEQLAQLWKQTVIVDNRPGASGAIAADFVARAAPDGYTLLVIMPDHVILPLVRKLSAKQASDFSPVSQLGIAPLLLMANPGLGVNSIQDLIALAKSKPGTLTYSTPGAASMHHLTQSSLNALLDLDMVHVPYKGGAPAMMDAIGGVVNLTLGSPAQSLPYVQSGKLKAVGVTSGARLPMLPDLPTLTETVAPGFTAGLWVGVLAPAGTPEGLVKRISQDIRQVMQKPEVRHRLADQGVEVVASEPAQFADFMEKESRRWADVVKRANIQAE